MFMEEEKEELWVRAGVGFIVWEGGCLAHEAELKSVEGEGAVLRK
jgi:hypothetical protein